MRVEPLALRRMPLLAAAVCFALGEGMGRLPGADGRPTILLLLAVVVLAALTLFALRRGVRVAMLPVAALWVAAGLWASQIEPAPAPQRALQA